MHGIGETPKVQHYRQESRVCEVGVAAYLLVVADENDVLDVGIHETDRVGLKDLCCFLQNITQSQASEIVLVQIDEIRTSEKVTLVN